MWSAFLSDFLLGVASPEPQALCVVLAQVGGAEGGWVQQASDIFAKLH